MKCPKCKSEDVQVTKQDDLNFIKCNHCGYDDALDEVYPSTRESQREKSSYSPYKTGGHTRAKTQ